MNILVVSATSFEIDPFFDFLEKEWSKKNFFTYEKNGDTISTLITGVGAVNMAFALARYTDIRAVDYIINAGLAGSFKNEIEINSVVEVVSDRFADLGIEERDGTFTDVFELELTDKNLFPYINGAIVNEKRKFDTNHPKVNAITVNKVHGNEHSIAAIKNKYNADIESMEGAAFFLACKNMDLKFTQLRSISNYVEPRNKSNWKIEGAIDTLNDAMINHLKYIIQIANGS